MVRFAAVSFLLACMSGCGVLKVERSVPLKPACYRIEEWIRPSMTKYDIADKLGVKSLDEPVLRLERPEETMSMIIPKDTQNRDVRYHINRSRVVRNSLGLLEIYEFDNGLHLYSFRFRNGLLVGHKRLR